MRITFFVIPTYLEKNNPTLGNPVDIDRFHTQAKCFSLKILIFITNYRNKYIFRGPKSINTIIFCQIYIMNYEKVCERRNYNPTKHIRS